MYQGVPNVRHCSFIDPRNRFSATVIANGGRIMSLGMNLFELVDSHPEILPTLPGLLSMERSLVRWDQVNLGGGRIWPAPQSLFGGRVPPLDLDLGTYKLGRLNESTIALISPACRETGLKIFRQISFLNAEECTMTSVSSIGNYSNIPKSAVPWDILQLKIPNYIRIGPLERPPEAFKEFGDPYTSAGFIRKEEGNGYWHLAFADHKNLPMFKLGFHFDNAEANGTIYAIFTDEDNRAVRLIESFPILKGFFPHNGGAEIFYNPFDKYVELEVLGRARALAPGESSEELTVNILIK